jgi:hypothetical protein
LGKGLACGKIVLIEGREGTGKSESARAWCEANLGRARFISLKGITSKTTFFRAVCQSLGLAASFTRSSTDMQARAEDVLKTSKLMLVLDESHHLLPSGDRVYAQPDLLNWVYTACTNQGAPLALITTAMFAARVRRVEEQVIWNFRQIERRIKHYIKLPEKPTKADLEAVAKFKLPRAGQAALTLLVGYAGVSAQSLTTIADTIEDATELAKEAGRDEPVFEDIKRAIHEVRMPTDKAKAESFGENAHRKQARKKATVYIDADPLQETCNPPSKGATGSGRGQDLTVQERPVSISRSMTPVGVEETEG